MTANKDKIISYNHKLNWQKAKIGRLSADKKEIIEIATPADFGGPDGFWSPEDLLVASVNSCVMTTFLFFIQKRKIKLLDYESKAEGFIEKKEGKLKFREIIIQPTIVIPEDVSENQIIKIIELSKKHCLISNSISCFVELKYQIKKR